MNRIQELRKKKSLQQKALAIELKVSQATISSWELGEKQPSSKNVARLADFFGVSIDYLLGRDCTTLPDEKEPTVNDDGLRAKAIERVQALSDPELVRVLDFLKGLEAGQEIESVPASDSDPTPKSSE